jgi:CheY-like chemotaxis protein
MDGGPSRKCVLIVDDEEVAREAMAKLLQWKGYLTWTAANGHEALAQLRAKSPIGLILLDLWMDGGDGWEFREAQRQEPTLAGIPVVVLSAVGDAAEWADNLGDVGYLRKPIKADELFVAVERFTYSPKPEVILMEGDAAHRRAAEKALRHHGFTVRTATDEEEAVNLFRRHAGTTTAVLLDADAKAAFARLRQIDAGVRCCLMSRSPEALDPGEAVRVFAKSANGLAEMPQVLWDLATKSVAQGRNGGGLEPH